MKRIIVIAIFLGTVSQTYCQDTGYIFFDKMWKETKEWKAKFVRKEITLENGFVVELSKTAGGLIYQAAYSSLDPDIEHGVATQYNTEGKLIEKAFFREGYPDSTWIFLDPQTSKYDSVNYTGIRDLIEENKKGPSYPNAFTIVEEMPTFPNDNDIVSKELYVNFHAFIESEYYYPIEAKKRKIQGSVLLSFVVGPDGYLHAIKS